MAASTNPLADLRDIHLPEPVGWWPPAPGWWLVGVVGFIVLALSVWFIHRHRRQAPMRAALSELQDFQQNFAARKDSQKLAADLSALLKRVALLRFPHRNVAGLNGDAWLRFLDRSGGLGVFADGPGQVLARAPYRQGEEYDPNELMKLVENWIRRVWTRRMESE